MAGESAVATELMVEFFGTDRLAGMALSMALIDLVIYVHSSWARAVEIEDALEDDTWKLLMECLEEFKETGGTS